MKKAIAIIAYNRPEYFARCLNSIMQNNIDDFDVFIFIDGNSSEKEHIEITKSHNRSIEIITQHKSLGSGLHQFYVKNFIFKERNYDRCLFIEDDVITSKYLVDICENLYEWGNSEIGDIGAVSGFSAHPLLVEEKRKNIDKVLINTIMGAIYIDKLCWLKIEPLMSEYISFIKDIKYSERPHTSIQEWMKNVISRSHNEHKLAKNSILNLYEYFKIDNFSSAQDVAMSLSMLVNGYCYLSTYVNRALNIGEYGTHVTPETFKNVGFDKLFLEEYESDKELKNFNLVYERI